MKNKKNKHYMLIKNHGSLKKDIKKIILNTPNLSVLKNNSNIKITENMFYTRIISSIILKCVYHQKKGDIGKIIISPNFRDVKNPNIQITKNMYFAIKNNIIIILLLLILFVNNTNLIQITGFVIFRKKNYYSMILNVFYNIFNINYSFLSVLRKNNINKNIT